MRRKFDDDFEYDEWCDEKLIEKNIGGYFLDGI